MRDASEKRTTASVASARVLTARPSASGSTRPRASTPSTSPAAVNTIAAVIGVPSRRRGDGREPEEDERDERKLPVHGPELRRAVASGASAAHALEPDRPPESVERTLERVLEGGGPPDPALEVERLDDERSFLALRLQVGTSDDAVPPEERQHVVAEPALGGRLVHLDHVLEPEDSPREGAVPQEVVERGEEHRGRRTWRLEVGSRCDEHRLPAVLHPDALEEAVLNERVRVRTDPRRAAAEAPVLDDARLRKGAPSPNRAQGQVAEPGRLVGFRRVRAPRAG